MITISLCMIVKNEEKVLAECLDSLKNLVDEIIILDTGSTDRTKEIAAQYTEKLYDYVWTEDFAAARNASFSRATMDYIYCADADEVLDSENQKRFLVLKQVLLPEVEIVQMKYSGQLNHNTVYNFDEEYRPKLYKRLRTFRFADPVHETVLLEPLVYDSDICIFHKPHASHTSRDLAIFERHYADKKEALGMSARLLTMYAKELFISGSDQDFVRSLSVFEALAADTARSDSEQLVIAAVLAHTYRVQGNTAAFFKYAMKGVASDCCSEICMELGLYYEALDDPDEAYHWFYNAAFDNQPVCNIHLGGDTALYALSRILQKAGMTAEAAGYQEQAEKWTPDFS